MTGDGRPPGDDAEEAVPTIEPRQAGQPVPAGGAVETRQSLETVMTYRAAAIAVIAVIVGVLPVFGPWRIWLGGFIAVAGLVANQYARVALRHRGELPRILGLCDAVIALVVIAAVPESYPVVVTVIAGSATLTSLWFGNRSSVGLLAVTAAGLLGIGVWADPPLWVPAFGAWAVTSVCSLLVLGRLADALAAGRDRYDALLNGIDAAVWEAEGPEGPADYLSVHVERMLGYSADQMRDLDFLIGRVHPEDRRAVLESRRRIAEGHDVERHFRIRDASGRWRHVQDRVRVCLDADGNVVRRRGVLVDDTARWEAERSVRRYHDFIDSIPIALVILRQDDLADPLQFTVVAANPAVGDIFHLDVDESIGRSVTDSVELSDAFLERLADVIRTGEVLEMSNLQVPGNDRIFALKVVPLPDRCLGVSLEDITNRALKAESLRHRALHDALTGLPNRALLHERLTRALIQADRTGDNVGLLLVDLDQFKEVNDALGHAYGDALLRELADRLSARLRDCDTVARLGGDEFAILLTTGASESGALDVASRVADLCEQPVEVGDYRLQVSASVGIALAPLHANDAETLMRRADGAMYESKRRGASISTYSPGHELKAVRRLELLGDLRTAIAEEDFVVHYQPRLDVATLRPVGIEALVRWEHPRHGLLMPEEFIELSEVSGAIRQLTKLVTERAARDLEDLDVPELTVSVNLSARNLYDPGLVGWVSDLLAHVGAAPGSLWFELTESQLMDDPSQSAEVLTRLHDAGVRFSVDDFGTGPSSVGFLRDLPLDEIKIDSSFVRDLECGDDRVVRSAISLGHHLGLRVVAEGVETPKVLEILRTLGCDLAQGYHLAEPMPLGALVEYLQDTAAGTLPRLESA